MALLIYWYDFICFGVVGLSFLASLWVLWRKELASKNDGNTAYESLLVSRPDTHGYVQAMPRNHVGSFQLWTSCWTEVHPGWLMATRLVSFLILAGFLSWDIMDWGATIFMYYTDQANVGLGYWFRWQVPVCGFIIISCFMLSIHSIKKVKAEALCLHELWRPQWRNLNPLWLLCYRIFAFICLSPMLWEIVALDGAFAFYFYTQWTFALVMVYFAIGTAMSAYGCWVSSMQTLVEDEESGEYLRRDIEETGPTNSTTYRRKEVRSTIKLQSRYAEEALRLRAGFWGYLMQTVYQTCAGAVILTDLIFWCIIVPFGSNAHLELNALMGCMHTLNAVCLLLDTALNSMPFPWFRLAYFVIWSCIYVVFQWVIHACGFTWWPYPFLELDLSWAPYWYLALAVVHIPCYGIYALIIKAKNSLFSKWFPTAFVRPY